MLHISLSCIVVANDALNNWALVLNERIYLQRKICTSHFFIMHHHSMGTSPIFSTIFTKGAAPAELQIRMGICDNLGITFNIFHKILSCDL